MSDDTPISGEPEEYKVGYGRPPETTRFKPGQSGNAKGRPKGSKNFGTALDKELGVRIPINENGQRKKVTKREAIAKQLVNKAASGDPRTLLIALNEIRQREAQKASAPTTPDQNPKDQRVMESIIARIKGASEQPNPTINTAITIEKEKDHDEFNT